jgi:integrase
LVEAGREPASIVSLADLVSAENAKSILRRRLAGAGGQENTFNHSLGKALVQIAYEWVRPDPSMLADLKRTVRKLPVPLAGLTSKNKRFLRQFDEPAALRRLFTMPYRLWAEVKGDKDPNSRTLAKAQAALAIAILSYMPLRLENLTKLKFDTHLFLQEGRQATSTLELAAGEVKNRTELAFDIPPHLAKMLIEYRDRIAPRIIGHRPAQLFVNVRGALKGKKNVAWLIGTYSKARAGIVLTPHQFRHLSAKNILDAQPGAFETVKQLLGHKSSKTTEGAYAGIDSRRAARHHAQLVEQALAKEPAKKRGRAK